MKIYVITGSQGEYSDRSEWVVEAHKDGKKAKDRVQELTDANRADYAEFQRKMEEGANWDCYIEEQSFYITETELL